MIFSLAAPSNLTPKSLFYLDFGCTDHDLCDTFFSSGNQGEAMLTEELIQATRQYLMDTYTRYPLALARGRGTRVYDVEGREYLDFLAGIAVNVLGHCHPKITLAVQQQAQALVHTSNLFYTEPQVRLARVLVDHSFGDKVFFCNSGAEANEAAIKLVRRVAHERDGGGRFEIVSMLNSLHGRTLATLTATGQEKVHKGFEPLP
ncbi:MAG TPA: aminotransferase class III-fold pyridoxal phosphate-dependent enzyme, partial [Nitrospiria bacterium]